MNNQTWSNDLLIKKMIPSLWCIIIASHICAKSKTTQNSWNVQCVRHWLRLPHLVNRDIDHGVWAVLEIFLTVPIANSVYLHRVDQLKRTKTSHISLGYIVGIRVVGLITKVIGFVSVMINLGDYLYISRELGWLWSKRASIIPSSSVEVGVDLERVLAVLGRLDTSPHRTQIRST